MVYAVSCRLLTAEIWFQSLTSVHGICGGQSGTGTGFSLGTSVFSCQCHSENAPYSFLCHKSNIILAVDCVFE